MNLEPPVSAAGRGSESKFAFKIKGCVAMPLILYVNWLKSAVGASSMPIDDGVSLKDEHRARKIVPGNDRCFSVRAHSWLFPIIEMRPSDDSHLGIASAQYCSMIKSITNTTFFRRIRGTNQGTTFWGRLGERLVESEKKVIVYDLRGVLHTSDTVEEAAEFYARNKVTGRLAAGGIYMHCDHKWQPVTSVDIQVVS